MRIELLLEHAAGEAIAHHFGLDAPALVRATQDPAHGDYQVNGILPLAKKLKRSPRQLAAPVAERLGRHAAFEHVRIAGPGFINLTLKPAWIGRQLNEAILDHARDAVDPVHEPQRIVIDFSSPNIAKQPHVGHLRSTIIGDALVRLHRFMGHSVVGDNHLGDWGTQFGLLIAGARRFRTSALSAETPLAELERVYKLASERAKTDPVFAEEARGELAKLQAGDSDNLAMWRHFVAITRSELERIYDRLDVQFDSWLPESFYNPLLAPVVEQLLTSGVARMDQGAVCVFFDDVPELRKSGVPLIVRKRDGAYNYATTDVATLLHRRDELRAQRALYVVDKRQAQHFRQLFALAARLKLPMQLEHVAFGTILGKDGTPLKTKEGDNVKLADLLDEAEQRATAAMRGQRDQGLTLEDGEIASLAACVGIGAVKYSDLRQHRLSDYRFDWDKMISFKGNASPYLQYAHARIHSIFRKGGLEPAGFEAELSLRHPAEVTLSKQLLRFADAVHHATDASLPHVVGDHLYCLARAFSVFYEACPVLHAADRGTRLALSALAARQLRRGLELLGIRAPERM